MSTTDKPGSDAALSVEEFTDLIAALGPFERAPHLAVGCSGGADSLALTLLLGQWAETVGGRVTALIVDHGIRDEAAAEARRVEGWLVARGIDSEILQAGLFASLPSLQEAARAARYRLMTDWCRSRGVLHLCVAHHQEDQAETLLLNLTRGSGVDGLAGMASVSERADIRLLRPLLTVPKACLEAVLGDCDQAFIEDPSNVNPAFKRVRLRAMMPQLAAEGGSAGRLAKAAGRMAEARAALDAAATSLLGVSAALYPEGYARLELTSYAAATREVALRALARLLRTVGGKSHPPRGERLIACYEALCTSAKNAAKFGRTLGGCRLLKRRGDLFICREVPNRTDVEPMGDKYLWDGRFLVSEPPERAAALTPLGTRTLPVLAAYKRARIPAPFRHALPVSAGLDGAALLPKLKGVALLSDWRADWPADKTAEFALEVSFQPKRPLSDAPFHAVT